MSNIASSQCIKGGCKKVYSDLISVVIPMYFEEAVAEETYKRLTAIMKEKSYNYELVFVNDGSTL